MKSKIVWIDTTVEILTMVDRVDMWDFCSVPNMDFNSTIIRHGIDHLIAKYPVPSTGTPETTRSKKGILSNNDHGRRRVRFATDTEFDGLLARCEIAYGLRRCDVVLLAICIHYLIDGTTCEGKPLGVRWLEFFDDVIARFEKHVYGKVYPRGIRRR